MREEFPFLENLARLERSLIEVFHAPDAIPLDAEQMRAIAPEDWPALELKLHPAQQILELKWNVATIIEAVEQGREPSSPPRDDISMIVWRNRNRVYYRAIDATERGLLAMIADGASFTGICEVIADNVEGDAAAAINQRLETWLRDGILVHVLP